jgi:ribosomal protein S18 acetylase RimI-like enzyme
VTPTFVREAGPEDAAAISRLHAAVWRETYAGLLPDAFLASLDTASWMSPAAWTTRITRVKPWRGVLAAGDGDELIGFAGYRALGTPEDGYRGEIAQIYLLRRAQRHGLGTLMMRLAAEKLAAEGLTPFLLWVFVDNAPANAFYRNRGGTLLGRRQTLTLGGQEIDEHAYGWSGPEAVLTP